jgi:hypothetical protein
LSRSWLSKRKGEFDGKLTLRFPPLLVLRRIAFSLRINAALSFNEKMHDSLNLFEISMTNRARLLQ